MKATIKAVNVYNTILEETRKDILVESDGKKYLGGLLDSEKWWTDDEIKETIDEIQVEGTKDEVIDAIYGMKVKNGLKVYDCTKRTLDHWGYINGLFS